MKIEINLTQTEETILNEFAEALHSGSDTYFNSHRFEHHAAWMMGLLSAARGGGGVEAATVQRSGRVKRPGVVAERVLGLANDRLKEAASAVDLMALAIAIESQILRRELPV